MLILIIILISIICLAAFFMVWWKGQVLYEIASHRFPRLICTFLVLLLALITFIFGIHADIFSSYDKFNSEFKNVYNWFNPRDIVRFPIDQFGINRNIFPECELNIEAAFYKPNKERKYFFVIDRSGSVKPNKLTKKYSQHIIGSVKGFIENSIEIDTNKLKCFSLEDLLILSGIERLSRDESFTTTINIVYYFGNKEIKSPFDSEKQLSASSLPEIIGEFYSFVEKTVTPLANKAERDANIKTNFKFLAEELSKEKRCKGITKASSCLMIFSDFEHEEMSGNSFESVHQFLQKLNTECKIEQVDLVKINGANKHPDWAKQTTELFRQTFNHLYYYEYDEYLEESSITYQEQIASLFSSTKDDFPKQPIFLYYSWNNENYNYDYKGKITFKKLPGFKEKKLLVNYGNRMDGINNYEKNSYLSFKSRNQKLFPFKQFKIESDLETTDTLLFVTSQKESKNYFLEISKAGSTQRIREPIVLREVLPVTSCTFLIYFYFVFALCLMSLIAYFIFFLYEYFVLVGMKKFSKAVLTLAIVFALLFLICICQYLAGLSKCGFLEKRGVIIFLLGICCLVVKSALFYHSYKTGWISFGKLYSHEKES